MAPILDKIAAYKREEVSRARQALSQTELEARARQAPPVRGFAKALDSKIAEGKWALIAEIKKASPSKGLIRADFDPPALAGAYAALALSEGLIKLGMNVYRGYVGETAVLTMRRTFLDLERAWYGKEARKLKRKY